MSSLTGTDKHNWKHNWIRLSMLSRSHDPGWQGSGQKQKDFLSNTYRVTQRICWQVCHNDYKNKLAQTGTKITHSVSHDCQQNAREQSSKLQTSTGSTVPRATEVKGQGPVTTARMRCSWSQVSACGCYSRPPSNTRMPDGFVNMDYIRMPQQKRLHHGCQAIA